MLECTAVLISNYLWTYGRTDGHSGSQKQLHCLKMALYVFPRENVSNYMGNPLKYRYFEKSYVIHCYCLGGKKYESSWIDFLQSRDWILFVSCFVLLQAKIFVCLALSQNLDPKIAQ